jgi:hypothetical protein
MRQVAAWAVHCSGTVATVVAHRLVATATRRRDQSRGRALVRNRCRLKLAQGEWASTQYCSSELGSALTFIDFPIFQ